MIEVIEPQSERDKTFVKDVFNNINQMRIDPKSFIKNFKAILSFARINKNNSYVLDDTTSLINYLEKSSTKLPELILSKALCKVANKRLEVLQIEENEIKFCDIQNKIFNATVAKEVTNYNKIHEISYKGANYADQMIIHLFMHQDDTQKLIRRIMFDPSLRYVGISTNFADSESKIVNLIFSERADEYKADDTSIENLILKEINSFRSNPLSQIAELEMILKNFAILKRPKLVIEDLSRFIQLMKQDKIHENLKLNSLLNQIANEIFRTNTIIRDNIKREDLDRVASKYIQDYKSLYGFMVTEETDFRKIVSKLFFNEKLTTPNNWPKKTLLHDENKLLGVYHASKDKIPLTIIIVADSTMEKDRPIEESLLEDINKVRNNPVSIIPTLRAYKQTLVKNPLNKKEIIEDIDDFINRLEKSDVSYSLILSKALCNAALDYINENNLAVFNNNLYREEPDFLKVRLGQYIVTPIFAEEFVEVGKIRPQDLIFNMLIDKHNEEKTKRNSLLNKMNKFIGMARKMLNGKTYTVIILTDSAKEKSNEVQSSKDIYSRMEKEISDIRQYPKSYLKVFQNKIEELRQFRKTKTEDFINFLKKTRYYDKLESNEYLEQAAQQLLKIRHKSVDEFNNTIKQENINAFLDKVCFLNVNLARVITLESKDPYLKELLPDPFNKEIIFNISFKYIGCAYDEEHSFLVIILSDRADEKVEKQIKYNSSNWKNEGHKILTPDEVEQIQRDFNLLGVLNEGDLNPNFLLKYMDSIDLKNKNPIYYEASKKLSEEHTYDDAVISQEIILDKIQHMLTSYKEEQWKRIFNIVSEGKKVIDSEMLISLFKRLNYEVSDYEVNSIFTAANSQGGRTLSKKVFVEIMNEIQLKRKHRIDHVEHISK